MPRCPACHAELPEGARFCGGCGRPLPAGQVPPPLPPVDRALPPPLPPEPPSAPPPRPAAAAVAP
ncbi:MAG: zinc ribbon domain-containing protein, partial [Acidobacteria bacterium]|nr:zinc ribbon domain-containing protein [Acidobacteriota bacterium]